MFDGVRFNGVRQQHSWVGATPAGWRKIVWPGRPYTKLYIFDDESLITGSFNFTFNVFCRAMSIVFDELSVLNKKNCRRSKAINGDIISISKYNRGKAAWDRDDFFWCWT